MPLRVSIKCLMPIQRRTKVPVLVINALKLTYACSFNYSSTFKWLKRRWNFNNLIKFFGRACCQQSLTTWHSGLTPSFRWKATNREAASPVKVSGVVGVYRDVGSKSADLSQSDSV